MQYSNFEGVVPLNSFPLLEKRVKREILFIFHFPCPRIPCHSDNFSHIKSPALALFKMYPKSLNFYPQNVFWHHLLLWIWSNDCFRNSWALAFTLNQKNQKKTTQKTTHYAASILPSGTGNRPRYRAQGWCPKWWMSLLCSVGHQKHKVTAAFILKLPLLWQHCFRGQTLLSYLETKNMKDVSSSSLPLHSLQPQREKNEKHRFPLLLPYLPLDEDT